MSKNCVNIVIFKSRVKSAAKGGWAEEAKGEAPGPQREGVSHTGSSPHPLKPTTITTSKVEDRTERLQEHQRQRQASPSLPNRAVRTDSQEPSEKGLQHSCWKEPHQRDYGHIIYL